MSPLFVTFFFGLAGLAGAACLFRLAARGSRAGDQPHCGRCDYDLTGLPPAEGGRCPECGTPLDAGSTTRGGRVRQPVAGVAGVVLSVLMLPLVLFPALQIYQNYNWYGLRPLAGVIDDAASNAPRVARRAWAELLQRRADGVALSPEQRDGLTRLALARQQKVNAVASDWALQWLGAAAARDGELTPEQQEEVFRQCVRMSLRVREKAVAGDRVPFELFYTDRLHDGHWWTRVDPIRLTCDGIPADEAVLAPEPQTLGSLTTPFAPHGLSTMPSAFLASCLPIRQPGRHTLQLTARVNVFSASAGANKDPLAATPVHRHDVVLTAQTDVLAAAGAGAVTMTRDPAMEQRLRSSIVARNFWWITLTNPRGDLSGEVDVFKVPGNVAFEVFARVGGKEYALGSLAVAKGESNIFGIGSDDPALASVSQFDLVLRASESAARRTVDLDEVWDGELVIPGVAAGKVGGDPR